MRKVNMAFLALERERERERERELSKLPESTEGKAMDKDTFFIMENNLRLLLQENTFIYKKFLLSREPVSASQFLYSVP